MTVTEWEATIRQIVDETNQQPMEAARHRILVDWRARLEQEPTSLPPYKIDVIVREVRRRLESKRP